MSSIRTLEELQDAMAKEFVWRKRELTGIKALVVANEKTRSKDLYIRPAVTLLYAHWEGFVKQISLQYLEFVSRRRLKYKELSASFVAMAIRRQIQSISAGKKFAPCLDLVAFFRSPMDERIEIVPDREISTRSNLKSEVLQEIMLLLGLDYSRFATKEKLLDEKLLGNRNQIAHGQYLLVDYHEYLGLHDEILGMMQDFYNQIDNSAYTGAYKR